MSADRHRTPPGRDAIRPRALTSLATAIVAEAARVPAARAAAVLQDRRGQLVVRATVPARLDDGTTIVASAERIRDHLVWGIAQLADRVVAEVEVRFDGFLPPEPRRLR